MKTTLLPGIYAASLTPMHEDYSCNCQALVEHCNDLMNRGCRGVVLFGTTGEGPSLSVEERQSTLISVIKLGLDPQSLIVGVSCPAIPDAIRLAKTAAEQRCAGVLIVPPFFYKKVDEAGVIAYYREVIRGIKAPQLNVILYHIPQHSGVCITLNIIQALRKEFPDQVVGIKESEGNLPFAKDVLVNCPGFKLFAGNELHLTELLPLGASGGISGAANAFPELISSLFASTANVKQLEIVIQAIRSFSSIPAIKDLVARRKGKAWRILRPPLTPLTEIQSHNLYDKVNI